MTTCTRRLEIDAGHRLLKHEGKCRYVHGHRYVFDVTCAAESLDEVGRVIDFGRIKEIVGGWLDTNIDHGFVAQKGDPIIDFLKADGSKLYEVDFSPTAENICQHVLEKSRELLRPLGIEVVSIKCWETPNGWATTGDR